MNKNDRRADPTPHQIREACSAIQATWSDVERFKRMRPDMRPEYRLADGEFETMTAADYELHHERQGLDGHPALGSFSG